jgi:endonuclease III
MHDHFLTFRRFAMNQGPVKRCPFAAPVADRPVDIDEIYRRLEIEFHKVRTPVVDLIAIQTGDPFKVLVATMLSARTKDQTTSTACARLFARVQTPADLEAITEDEIASLVHPVGFARQKAAHLKLWPDILRKCFDGRIPDEIDDLVLLPGVGRKTANLVLAVAFRKPAVCVDVHVHRIMNRLGYVVTRNPAETEIALRKILPQKYWLNFNSYFVAFGQHLCAPRNPNCAQCPIADLCRRKNVFTKYHV